MSAIHTTVNQPAEWSLVSTSGYADPFAEVELDVVVTAPSGAGLRVPAFWSGENVWRVRFSAAEQGSHHWRSLCSNAADSGLHGREGVLEAAPYEGENPLYRHGPLRVAASRRHLEHRDGTPFFWLGDTWWMGLCRRLAWPGEFRELVADRVAKGFSVVQIVAGLYPDMPALDPRGENEAGFPWTEGFGTIRPSYFDMADLRIDALVRSGLVPCLVGCWGYYLPWLGEERMRRHWRYLVARYGAYPVVWCLAGEGKMPYYLSGDREGDRERQREGWSRLAAYVREIDPYRHPLTIHPSAPDSSRTQVTDPSLLDLEWLQTGHGDRRSLPSTVDLVRAGYEDPHRMPVLNSEVCYEGIGEMCRQEVQRLMFWASVLSGACGHTYGANGIWQLNRRGEPYGPSPHGMSWGDTPWDEAAALPGSRQLGLAKKLLERYEWWRFEPHPEWVEPRWTKEDYLRPYAAGIPGKTRVIYIPATGALPTVKQLEPGVSYRALLWNPVDGTERRLSPAGPDDAGDWRPTPHAAPIYQDWVLVLERT